MLSEAAIEVLFRDSSVPDGVQARGAGWHSQEVPGKRALPRLSTLQEKLAEGDLVKLPGKLGELYVHDGQSLRAVGPLNWRAAASPSGAPRFWGAARDGASLLLTVPEVEAAKRLIVASACDLAETILRSATRGEERPRRALRVTRRWLAGAATFEEVRSAARAAAGAASTRADAAYIASAAAYVASAPEPANAAAYVAVYVADWSVTMASGLVQDDPVSRASRSLTFLVRARIPLWRVCLLAAERVGE